ncbi:hypothetical protein [Staphylococcus pasteuri]|uniref:hypothetical protein n=1 Tax=Staphylococcus pasteuri TaxID=45972 RepID=UPI000E69CFDD|nr:hypothetical protein [Staphylococcus pasteuri]MCT1925720.1 hypothetical protein [Staphylococcus pasteuri]QQT11279.1 hypothetical protein I6J09_00625 [Staphylococcus pasteuri]RIO47022.1 hypothetical protein BUZ64_12135 [Staphylococcus pasteuri]
MRIEDAYRKDVVITTLNNKKYIGFITDYENEFESETGNVVIDLETDLGFFSFDESEIKQIEIIEK